jgi:hypothetical protein
MRTGVAVDKSLRGTDPASVDRRNTITGLITDLVYEVHFKGDASAHGDPKAKFLGVNDVSTCVNPLCVHALSAISDINNIAAEFPAT